MIILTWAFSEVIIEIVLITWIMVATINGLKKVAPIEGVKSLGLMQGIWKLEAALGLSLAGLAGFGIAMTILYPYSYGILALVLTFVIFYMTYEATKDLEKVPLIAQYTKKIESWSKKRK